MKIEIEVFEWWNVSYQETFQTYDQREGQYTSTREKTEKFMSEGAALTFVEELKLRRPPVSNIIFSHAMEM